MVDTFSRRSKSLLLTCWNYGAKVLKLVFIKALLSKVAVSRQVMTQVGWGGVGRRDLSCFLLCWTCIVSRSQLWEDSQWWVGEDVRRETRKVSVSKNTAVLWGTMKHRLAVVGAGMIGSSAARWASVTSASSSEGGNVVLVSMSGSGFLSMQNSLGLTWLWFPCCVFFIHISHWYLSWIAHTHNWQIQVRRVSWVGQFTRTDPSKHTSQVVWWWWWPHDQARRWWSSSS